MRDILPPNSLSTPTIYSFCSHHKAVLEDPVVRVLVEVLPDGDGQEDDDEADQEHGDEHAAQHVQAAVRVIWNSKQNVRLYPKTEVLLR